MERCFIYFYQKLFSREVRKTAGKAQMSLRSESLIVLDLPHGLKSTASLQAQKPPTKTNDN